MTRPILLGTRLTKDEYQALIIWANSEGLDKSVLFRRLFRLALRGAPRSIFPPQIVEALNLSEEVAL
ncbi:MAG: hypothetical protein ABI904_12830 [Chloroflexota bacterium]